MTDTASISRNQIKTRRQELQHQRRLRALQGVWRFITLSTLAGGAIWAIAQPHWSISAKSPIEIEGNQLLSKDQIRQFLSIEKPQSVWQLPTQQLLARLQDIPPIANVQITRQILPSKLIVEVQERQPVAVATSKQQEGFLDEKGVFIAKSFYQSRSDKNWKEPSLKVVGYQELYRDRFSQLYPLITRSAVKIFEIDWHNPSNLILKTELGVVYLGSYGDRFSEQLTVLAQMRKLSSRFTSDRLVYIDLSNPALPTIQLKSNQKLKSKLVEGSARNQ
jgi:cell division protein FtsQ